MYYHTRVSHCQHGNFVMSCKVIYNNNIQHGFCSMFKVMKMIWRWEVKCLMKVKICGSWSTWSLCASADVDVLYHRRRQVNIYSIIIIQWYTFVSDQSFSCREKNINMLFWIRAIDSEVTFVQIVWLFHPFLTAGRGQAGMSSNLI